MPDLAVGDIAPDFDLPSDQDPSVSLTSFAGKTVVLYFYPRDDTSGCTKEAIGFTEKSKDFAQANAVVLGVSKDTVTKHGKFREKYKLGVHLLSDAESDLCERYGVWVEKKMYGKTFFGIVRTTVLIDKDGKVAKVWKRVKVDGHDQAVIDEAKSLID